MALINNTSETLLIRLMSNQGIKILFYLLQNHSKSNEMLRTCKYFLLGTKKNLILVPEIGLNCLIYYNICLIIKKVFFRVLVLILLFKKHFSYNFNPNSSNTNLYRLISPMGNSELQTIGNVGTKKNLGPKFEQVREIF